MLTRVLTWSKNWQKYANVIYEQPLKKLLEKFYKNNKNMILTSQLIKIKSSRPLNFRRNPIVSRINVQLRIFWQKFYIDIFLMNLNSQDPSCSLGLRRLFGRWGQYGPLSFVVLDGRLRPIQDFIGSHCPCAWGLSNRLVTILEFYALN